ncbi:MAG: hypothetical protein NZ951_04455 [Dehalococcoidia bacterium]|nr:hypothetical protein [Dehalococcoidia bacterium]MDW8120365.1 hypothetical protein [Chloroflexota bacterium]
MLEITFSGGVLRCPETPEFLEVAMHLLQVLREQERAGQARRGGEGVPSPLRPSASPPPAASPPPGASSAPVSPSPGRVRWFVTHRPRIQIGPGQVVEPSSIQELKEFLQARGLTPHPRGDASMLLWQVRVRLGLPVEAAPVEGATGTP